VCVSVSVALVIQHEMHMRPIDVCGVSGSIIFFHIISQRAQFKKKIIQHRMCVLIISTIFVSNIFHSKNNRVRYDHICLLVCM